MARRRKRLSPEDRRLWAKVAETATPLRPVLPDSALPEGLSPGTAAPDNPAADPRRGVPEDRGGPTDGRAPEGDPAGGAAGAARLPPSAARARGDGAGEGTGRPGSPGEAGLSGGASGRGALRSGTAGQRMAPPFRIGETASAQPPPAAAPKAAPRMDAGRYRRLARGKVQPEARLDLHGLTVAEAHGALIRFVTGERAAGRRLLLVITGKGDLDRTGLRGQLRRQVPMWLAAPPLGALVLEVREAHRRHGGSGALYVYLRRA